MEKTRNSEDSVSSDDYSFSDNELLSGFLSSRRPED